MQIETRVSGIPCLASCLSYTPSDPGRTSGPPDLWRPPEPARVDFEILDRRGRPAHWLTKKMTQADETRIASEFAAVFEE